MTEVVATVRKNAAEEIRVALTEYQGKRLCDIRVFTEYRSTGEIGPTKKGLSVRIEQLPELIKALQDVKALADRERRR